jgi:bifunctional non-homologous end joining protein LigD
MVWDQGDWSPDTEDVTAALQKGELKFTLHGRKLRGSWVLVRTGRYESKQTKPWLLIKHRDKYASERDITLEKPRSVLTKRLLADIARDEGGNVAKSATGDPKIPGARK